MDKLLLPEPFLTGKPREAWLVSMGIKGWNINDGLVDVQGGVDIRGKLGELKRLPVRFGKVGGNFWLCSNQLVSLEGAPKKLDGWFSCDNNKLVSLEGGPKEVGGDFSCESNQLVSLDGVPKKVGGNFYCGANQLVSLDGAPNEVGKGFYCHENQLVSLEGAPERVGGVFGCGHNQLVSLEGAPKKVVGNFNCSHNLIVDFKGLERVSIDGSLIVTNPREAGQDNVFVSLDGLPKELYSKVVGLDIPFVMELTKKQSANLLGSEEEELISEVELG